MSPRLSRREMLAAVVASSTIGLAGCSNSNDPTTSTSTPADTAETEVLTITANTSTTVSPTPTPSPTPISKPTPTATSTPSDQLVIEDGETETSSAGVYERIVWEETGRLVIEDGAGIELKEAE